MLLGEAANLVYYTAPDALENTNTLDGLSRLKSFDDGLSPDEHLSHGVQPGVHPGSDVVEDFRRPSIRSPISAAKNNMMLKTCASVSPARSF